ncbi:MAG: restriction endonuclease subunit S, partial [gamma proteobacterium symbiont of Clathrolucina costata]
LVSPDYIVFECCKGLYPEYLGYVTRSPNWHAWVSQAGTGSVRSRIYFRQLKEMSILLPPMSEQRHIVEILSTIDRKIENNLSQAVTLESMVREVYRSWFVNFDPMKKECLDSRSESLRSFFPNKLIESSLGEIPEGWSVATMNDLGEIKGGATPSTKNPDYWDEGTYNWITPKDMSDLKTKVILNTSRKITKEGVSKISSGQLPVGTVLMSSRAPVGYLAIASVPISINQGFIAIVCDKEFPSSYVVHCLEQNMDRIKANAGGSTFAEISKRSFKPIRILKPSKEILRRFDELASPLHHQVVELERENIALARMRDVLLPKLISGDLTLEEAEGVAA